MKKRDQLTLAYLRVIHHPVAQRTLALLRGDVKTAVEREEGQGLLEYIIAIAGVFMVAVAVMSLYRAIGGKYGEATASLT